ncbi:hypothetical protein EV383_5246 [Pseudonocardia sediminis]|uniref:Uncharacterized protein n=1 Tax=Pseudonocardia sediminis TaxID=1397368 RepID=A0A4Q7V1D5_PSEST|nr:hypothetical protein [Pseudonocardia sediminis]RZT88307.1 hypothetical protein EV383_5246 [Pseudonocardia sediminis]
MGIIAALIALAGLLAALGHVGYIAMLQNAANKKGLSGGEVATYAKSRWPVAGGAAGVSLIGLLIVTSSGSFGGDLFGLILALGGGVVGYKGLQTERNRYPSS